MRRIIYWLFAGTKGGATRVRIIKALKERPRNANQLSVDLGFDYKTIKHHIGVLSDNKLIVATGEKYAKLYFLSEEFEENYDIFEEIWEKFGEK
ncbi:MAG: winged helix-turn-helix domain-containing protein [Candidatus Hydrothermarchaeales archaeon]